jgi:hypothetical protein
MDMTEDDVGIYVTATAAKTSKNISQGSHKEGEKGNDEVKRILELQFRVRQMEPELNEKDAKFYTFCYHDEMHLLMLLKPVGSEIHGIIQC